MGINHILCASEVFIIHIHWNYYRVLWWANEQAEIKEAKKQKFSELDYGRITNNENNNGKNSMTRFLEYFH